MPIYSEDDSSDRRPADFFLFGLGFFAFLLLSAGVVLAIRSLALFGTLLLICSVWCFRFRRSPGE